MEKENYLSDLIAHLYRRGVTESQISEIVAEVEDHLSDSGEDPQEAFGIAAEYAEERAAFAEKNLNSKTSAQWHTRTFTATAFDEMGILKWAGQEGWELVDVGPLALNCRRPEDKAKASKWEYVRRTGANRFAITKEMEEGNWLSCGNWIVFHYFKRDTGILSS